MNERTCKLIEIVGTPSESVEEAIRNGLERATKTLRGPGWFQVH